MSIENIESVQETKQWIIALIAVFFISIITLVLVGFKLEMNANIIHLKKSEWTCTETERTPDRDGCVVLKDDRVELKYIGDKNHE